MNRTEAIICAVILALKRLGYEPGHAVTPKALSELDQAEAAGLRPSYPEVAASIAAVYDVDINCVLFRVVHNVYREVGGA